MTAVTIVTQSVSPLFCCGGGSVESPPFLLIRFYKSGHSYFDIKLRKDDGLIIPPYPGDGRIIRHPIQFDRVYSNTTGLVISPAPQLKLRDISADLRTETNGGAMKN